MENRMKYYIGVSEFGKINHAEIEISNFAIFLGNNNSGKTYLMQLLYGVLLNLEQFHFSSDLLNISIRDEVILENQWFIQLESEINEYLKNTKEKIVYQIFKKDIPIKNLYLRFEDYQNDRIVIRIKEENSKKLVQIDDNNDDERLMVRKITSIIVNFYEKNKIISKSGINFLGSRKSEILDHVIGETIIESIFSITRKSQIYIPASRTGLSLLYRQFFAEKDEKIVRIDEDGIRDGNKANDLGLTEPVYEYLKFLQKYNQKIDEDNTELIQFIEEYLLDGKMSYVSEQTLYTPKGTEMYIPLYLSSSMVNELVPIVKVLTSANNYSYIFYDEIELCLHPQKQQELARMLIRMNNRGKRLIVSTHSDTMASKINNLLLLAMSSEPQSKIDQKLEKLNLTKEDILANKNVHVYQFVNQPDGTSNVEELEFRTIPYVGYDFSLFEDNVQKLYDESLIITE